MRISLANALANRLQIDESEAAKLVADISRQIEESLESGKTLTIPGLGTFSGSDGRIVFSPSPALAAAVNADIAHPEGLTLPATGPPSPPEQEIASEEVHSEPEAGEEPSVAPEGDPALEEKLLDEPEMHSQQPPEEETPTEEEQTPPPSAAFPEAEAGPIGVPPETDVETSDEDADLVRPEPPAPPPEAAPPPQGMPVQETEPPREFEPPAETEVDAEAERPPEDLPPAGFGPPPEEEPSEHREPTWSLAPEEAEESEEPLEPSESAASPEASTPMEPEETPPPIGRDQPTAPSESDDRDRDRGFAPPPPTGTPGRTSETRPEASDLAGEIHGLDVLARHIEDHGEVPGQPRDPLDEAERDGEVRQEHPRREERRRRSLLPILLIGAVLLAALAAGAYYILMREPATPPIVAQEEAEAPPATTEPAAPAEETVDDPAEAGEAAAPETAAPAATDADEAPIDISAGGWTIVVGSAQTREDAERLADRYAEAGLDVAIVYGTFNGVTRYRIAVEQFESEAAASEYLRDAPDALPSDAWRLPLTDDLELSVPQE